MSPAPLTGKKKAESAATASAKRERKRLARKQPEQRAAASQQERKDAVKLPLGARVRARFGESGTRSLLWGIRAALVFGVALLSYVGAMFVAVTVVPNVFLVVSSGTGVGPASPFEMQMAYWLSPSLFLIGLIFVLVLVAVRWLWRAQRRVAERARRALLGEVGDQ
ncbi:hypothetical protein ABZ635_04260 [Nocardiopsis sp. NPDC007018]|uniref:hypothetical protein n=1 Tax=Nocardiopsis sp. NPDC007018 TaxID=3155721 RepID=UPI0033D7AF97